MGSKNNLRNSKSKIMEAKVQQSKNPLLLILSKLIDQMKIEAVELLSLEVYLFSVFHKKFTSSNIKLIEVAEYLKDIIQENSIRNANELVRYYEEKRKKTRAFLDKKILEIAETEIITPEAMLISGPADNPVISEIRFWLVKAVDLKDLFITLPRSICPILSLQDFIYESALNKARKNIESQSSQVNIELYSYKPSSHAAKKNNHKTGSNSGKEKLMKETMDSFKSVLKRFESHKPIQDNKLKKEIIKLVYYSKLEFPSFRKAFNNDLQKKKVCTLKSEISDMKKDKLISILEIDSFIDCIVKNIFLNHRWVILRNPPGHLWNTFEYIGVSVDIGKYKRGQDCIFTEISFQDFNYFAFSYIPLSKNYCLRIEPTKNFQMLASKKNEITPIEFEMASINELELVNLLIYSKTEQQICHSKKERPQPESMCKASDYKPD
jgi:hypothetical protein